MRLQRFAALVNLDRFFERYGTLFELGDNRFEFR